MNVIPPPKTSLRSLDEAHAELLARLAPVPTESVPLAESRGRVLAQDINADRASPPVDVSAMDGYALHTRDLHTLMQDGLPVEGEAAIGTPIRTLASATAMRIFTGSPVPHGANAVIKREDLQETPERITAGPTKSDVKEGMHIRRAGENARAGERIVPASVIITPSVIAAIASFGVSVPIVRRRVRIVIVVTGDEIAGVNTAPSPTGLRDSNGPMLASMLQQIAWLDVVQVVRVADDPDALRDVLRNALHEADCVLTTGGVSMGDHDHVPEIAVSLGGEPVFHRLAIRPGKPVFSAIFDGGGLLIGLPGNPVSALVTCRVIVLGALAKLAGAPVQTVAADAKCMIENNDTHPLSLERFLLINRSSPDRVRLVSGRGSGDIASMARSDGVVRVPLGESEQGPYDCYYWSIP